VDIEDTETVMERLRQFRHGIVFRIAAADLVGALPVMKVSDHLTWVAELVLEKALEVVWGQMTRRHGEPAYERDGEVRKAGIAIIGYGKLGGLEMGYGSDLDIVFLHNSQGNRQQTNGERPIENALPAISEKKPGPGNTRPWCAHGPWPAMERWGRASGKSVPKSWRSRVMRPPCGRQCARCANACGVSTPGASRAASI